MLICKVGVPLSEGLECWPTRGIVGMAPSVYRGTSGQNLRRTHGRCGRGKALPSQRAKAVLEDDARCHQGRLLRTVVCLAHICLPHAASSSLARWGSAASRWRRCWRTKRSHNPQAAEMPTTARPKPPPLPGEGEERSSFLGMIGRRAQFDLFDFKPRFIEMERQARRRTSVIEGPATSSSSARGQGSGNARLAVEVRRTRAMGHVAFRACCRTRANRRRLASSTRCRPTN